MKIKLDDLNQDSTPCEICVAINGRDIEPNKEKNYWNPEICSVGAEDRDGGSACTPADRATIKLLYNIKPFTRRD